ncbi:MAG: arylsulfatase [Planctomycetales bacterium]
MADDLGYAELGCYGQKRIATPRVDRLAAEGMRFTQHYSGNAVCAPSRCCLMTGKHPGRAYIRGNANPKNLQELKKKHGWEFPGQYPIPAEEITVAEMLKQQGYATCAAGKWGLGHFGTTGDPNKQGFDLFYGFNCQVHAHNHYPRFLWRNDKKEILPGNNRVLNGDTYSQDKFTEVALEFIKKNKDRPVFVYLPFAIPHLSIHGPEQSLAEYKGKITEEDHKHRGYLKHPFPRAGYAAMVSHMDRDVGKIMDLLEKLGLDENTLVMFTSDNGPTYDRLGGSDSEFFQSAASFRGLKGSLYEGGIRVPLVARWPGKIAPGSKTDHLSAFWDTAPTLAEIAGCKPPQNVDGISFAPTLLGKPGQQKPRDFLYWEFPSYGGQQAVATAASKPFARATGKPFVRT